MGDAVVASARNLYHRSASPQAVSGEEPITGRCLVLAFCQRRIKERQSPAHERSVEQPSSRQLGVAASSLVSNTAQVYYAFANMNVCIPTFGRPTRPLVCLFICLCIWQRSLAYTSGFGGDRASSTGSEAVQLAPPSDVADKLLATSDPEVVKMWLLGISRAPDKRGETLTSNKRRGDKVNWQTYRNKYPFNSYFGRRDLDLIGSGLLLRKRAGSHRLSGLDAIGSSLLLGKRTGNHRLSGLDVIGSSLLPGKRTGNHRLSGFDVIGSNLPLGERTGNHRLSGLDVIGNNLLKKRTGSRRLLLGLDAMRSNPLEKRTESHRLIGTSLLKKRAGNWRMIGRFGNRQIRQ
ncbi:hypothetical protein LSAT2_016344 [Lamellibrachia satsuma]|nr:hypothetical protein LSAT2_016344 [Lamellibrachia satsuma]